jgi:hypothetical protein
MRWNPWKSKDFGVIPKLGIRLAANLRGVFLKAGRKQPIVTLDTFVGAPIRLHACVFRGG